MEATYDIYHIRPVTFITTANIQTAVVLLTFLILIYYVILQTTYKVPLKLHDAQLHRHL